MKFNKDFFKKGFEKGMNHYNKEYGNKEQDQEPSKTDEQAIEAIPAEVRMISGCQDTQTSADVSNVSSFELPDPAGSSGGACTSALLHVLHSENKDALTFQEVLLNMRDVLKSKKFTQIPQLSSSRPLDIKEPFSLVPSSSDGDGTKRAVIIGINYEGQKGELSGCHNDANNVKEYLINEQGFSTSNITMLLDDGSHTSPTRNNILDAFLDLVTQTQAGDAAFVHYSGHGGKVKDDNGDEADGYDETLIPLDFQSAGQIRDDELFVTLVGAMPRGSTLTCLMDCCHSGTILDLPYLFKADGESEEMALQEGFNFTQLIGLGTMIGQVQNIGDALKVGLKIADIYKQHYAK